MTTAVSGWHDAGAWRTHPLERVRLSRDGGWLLPGEAAELFSLVLASLRQIAHEVDRAISAERPDLAAV